MPALRKDEFQTRIDIAATSANLATFDLKDAPTTARDFLVPFDHVLKSTKAPDYKRMRQHLSCAPLEYADALQEAYDMHAYLDDSDKHVATLARMMSGDSSDDSDGSDGSDSSATTESSASDSSDSSGPSDDDWTTTDSEQEGASTPSRDESSV